jgi:DnaJ-class molecular chaperone
MAARPATFTSPSNSPAIPTSEWTKAKIPSGIQSEARLRLPGHGVVNELGEHGDLTIVAHVRIPTRMTKDEYALWKELAKKSHFDPREE